MKKIALALTALAFLQAQELEIEGDLKVTGTVESTTIDSLELVIANMQAQIDAMQAGVSQKVIDVTIESGSTTSIGEIFPEYNLEWAVINIIDCPLMEGCFLEKLNTSNSSVHMLYYNHSADVYHYHGNNNSTSSFYTDDSNFVVSFGVVGAYTIKLLVTAQFQD